MRFACFHCSVTFMIDFLKQKTISCYEGDIHTFKIMCFILRKYSVHWKSQHWKWPHLTDMFWLVLWKIMILKISTRLIDSWRWTYFVITRESCPVFTATAVTDVSRGNIPLPLHYTAQWYSYLCISTVCWELRESGFDLFFFSFFFSPNWSALSTKYLSVNIQKTTYLISWQHVDTPSMSQCWL